MKQYLDLLDKIMREGVEKGDRTGTGTLSIFGHQMRFNLLEGFPLVTTKRVKFTAIVHELLWFLSGDTNIRYLNEKGIHIWDEWADKNGDLGPVYGSQWRKWKGPDKVEKLSDLNDGGSIVGSTEFYIDQISDVVRSLNTNPNSRRHIVTAWNPPDIELMALPPCHCLFQFYTSTMAAKERAQYLDNYRGITILGSDEEEFRHKVMDDLGAPRLKLSCQLYQRSCDTFLGVPFNIASYALLTCMIGQQVNMAPGDFIWTGGDTHLYLNHLDQVKLQLKRAPKPLPKLVLMPASSIFTYEESNINIIDYDYHPAIKAPISV